MSDVHDTSDPSTGSGSRRTFSLTIDATSLAGLGSTVGIALAGAAIAVAALFARDSGDLDVGTFVVGATASVLLLALSAWSRLTASSSERAADLVAWPGAAGALGAGVMLAVALDDGSTGIYAGGAVTLVVSVAGYLLSRATPFVVSTLAAVALLYIQVVDDLLINDGNAMYADDGDGMFMVIGGAATAFVVVVTLAGWFLPETRVLTGVLAGLGGLIALAGVMQMLMVFRVFEDIDTEYPEEFGEEYSEEFGEGYPSDEEFYDEEYSDPEFGGDFGDFLENNPYREDIYVVLGFCALLAAFWIACLLATGHTGFRLLLIADAVAMVPLGLFALATDGAAWWGTGFAVLGLAVLAATAYQARAARSGPAGPAPETGS